MTAPPFGWAPAPLCLERHVAVARYAVQTLLRAAAIWLWPSAPSDAAALIRAAEAYYIYVDDHFGASTPFGATAAHLLTILEGGALNFTHDGEKFDIGAAVDEAL
ncbi:hypothetical protein PPROV_000628800 [Pycnococcus provasolii]|uniref:Uncharacterized protein n=1 Tax=Pycnococcus provasolii TaxID=41880 RepID=A0A830HJJ0_9CHLO|nr:hypothetical protein PPROV_000628800 [Pycnococcus provasolii]